MIDWEQRAARLVEVLTDGGTLTDPHWADVMQAVPRHAFVPRFYEQSPDQSGWEIVSEQTAPERWAEAIYSDRSLATELLSTPDVLDGYPIPISSSTMPSLMARMLELLDVGDGHRVLEIGTGTGYNAALLSQRVGAQQVTTVELHPGVAAAARDRLADLGQHPVVVVGDGTAGATHTAPFDRIIATCGADQVPGAWVSQLGEGGRIVVDLRSESSSGLVVLDKIDPEHVSGRFVGHPGHFMWMRPDPRHSALEPGTRQRPPARGGPSTVRRVVIGADDLGRPGLRTLLGIDMPDVEIPAAGARSLRAGDGSWATLDASDVTVTQGGPHRLWDRVETLAGIWQQLGSPDTDRYGVTVSAEGQHEYWIDTPSTALPDAVQPRTKRRHSPEVGSLR
ncbi:methyltransferase domain-containing protein [Pseudonocardia sp. NPDC046786]|uniref:methyltransferase domain-containing protein n=1 Tax=Pseudonocardia sp. NPDC046786 TaxID=3155471 RepID=UPI0033C16C38